MDDNRTTNGGPEPSAATTFVAVMVGYLLLARLALLTSAPPEPAAIWPANGLVVGALLLLPRARTWAVVCGTAAASLVGNVLGALPPVFVFGYAAANVIECLAAARLIERSGGVGQLERVEHVARFLVVLALAAAVGALVGAGVAGLLGAERFAAGWQRWWTSDFCGLLVVVPLLASAPPRWSWPTAREIAISLGIAVLFAVVLYHSFLRPAVPGQLPIGAATLPFLCWYALRHGPRGAATATAVVAAVVLGSALAGLGRFGTPSLDLPERLQSAQFYVVVIAATALLLAAAVAEQITTARRLADLERDAREALEHTHLLALQLDAEARITYANPALCRVLGYEPGELIGRCWFETCLHPSDAPVAQRVFREALHDGEVLPVGQRRLVTRRGETRLVAWSNTLLRDEHGAVRGTSSIGEDITARHEAEDQARRVSRAYRVLSDCNQALMRLHTEDELFRTICQILVGPGGYALAWVGRPETGPARPVTVLAVAGQAAAYVRGRPFTWGETKEGSGPTGQAVRERRTVISRDPEPDAPGETWRQAARQHGLLASIAIPLLEGDQVLGLLRVYAGEADAFAPAEQELLEELAGNVAHGLTTLRARAEHEAMRRSLQESEDRYSALFEHGSAMMLVIDPAGGRILDANPAAATFYGYPREELRAMTIGDLNVLPPAELSALMVHTAQEGRRQFRFQHRLADGTLRDVEVQTGPVEIGGRSVLYSIVRDVTTELSLQEQLLQAQKMEAVGRLAGGIAHDFNNLLTTINGYAGFLVESLPEESETRGDAEEIRQAGLRAAALTRQLLAFSRKQVLQPRALNLNELLTGFERMLRRLIRENIDLTVDLEPQLGPVSADPTQLEQVVLNLVVNASDAMPSGGRLTLRTALVNLDSTPADADELAPGQYAVLTVEDTGTGIDPQSRPHIFEPFFTTKPPGQGTGLGLATVYGIVKQSRGHITCETEVGRGTTFRVYLPTTGQPVDNPLSLVEGAPTGTERVLLIEDDAPLRGVARRTLERHGYQVSEAATGEVGLQLLNTSDRPHDLVLTDLMLPGLSGLDVRERVRATHPGLPVLLMSGYSEEAAGGGLAPDAAFLSKPFTPGDLLRRVRHELDHATDRTQPS